MRRTGAAYEITLRHRLANGEARWFHEVALPQRDERGELVQWYGVSVDIDERKRAELALEAARAQLTRAAQIAAVAEASGSIAADLHAPLMAVVARARQGQVELATTSADVEAARASAQDIIASSNVAAKVVRRARSLFEQNTPSKVALDLGATLGEVCQLLSDELISRRVRLTIELDDPLPAVRADRMQLQQVIQNMLRNGIDALESLANEQRVLSIFVRRDSGGSVSLEVRDQAHMNMNIERAFDLFFAAPGSQAAMRLAVCRSIVEAHDGRVWAKPCDSGGNCFGFALPTLAHAADAS
jgi:signal transduction histidine kinase